MWDKKDRLRPPTVHPNLLNHVVSGGGTAARLCSVFGRSEGFAHACPASPEQCDCSRGSLVGTQRPPTPCRTVWIITVAPTTPPSELIEYSLDSVSENLSMESSA